MVVYQDIEPSGAGARAAQNIKDKHESKDVLIAVPTTDKKKVDWNDEYVSKGHQAFNGYKMHPEYRIQGIDFDKMWEEL